ncbi:(Na+)-NQR maturation NqrM [uncultured Cardiobacterium sp.]|uniref:(Na+)-NQR maturation NqrM n=1 Tax=uncultured Cardiobacterium sp. TaxID=417619 RepID=UPI002623F850|nr:(Na+)-NQR maturation NqrM [uncultured Cardiobacterium sp.]
MTTFIVVFIVLMLVGVGMAVGVIFGRAPIKGSCGGLGAVGVERACGCKDVCENKEPPATDGQHAAGKVKRYQP